MAPIYEVAHRCLLLRLRREGEASRWSHVATRMKVAADLSDPAEPYVGVTVATRWQRYGPLSD